MISQIVAIETLFISMEIMMKQLLKRAAILNKIVLQECLNSNKLYIFRNKLFEGKI